MKTILVDDEPIALKQLKWELLPYKEIEIIGTFQSSVQALKFAENHRIDFAVLDIEMPVMGGIQLGKELRKLYPEMVLIYVTGYANYIEGMLKREKEYPTYLDYGVMIPHGTEDTLSCVLHPGISIVTIPKGFPYLGHKVTFVIGISSKEEDPLQELMQITDILLDSEKRIRLLHPSSKQEIIDVINENYMEKGEI